MATVPGELMPIESRSLENQIEIPLLRHADIENPVEGQSVEHNRGPIQVCKLILKILAYLIGALVCFLVMGTIVVILPPACFLVMGTIVVILPPLWAVFAVVRMNQFNANDKLRTKLVVVKEILRFCMTVVALLLLLEVGILYPLAANIPKLKLLLIIGLPITEWIKVIAILAGIIFLNQIILGLKILFKEIHPVFKDGVFEIIDCLMLRWAEVVVMDRVPAFKQSKIYGLHTHEWIEVSIVVFIAFNIILIATQLLVSSVEKVYQTSCLLRFSSTRTGKLLLNRRYTVYVVKGVQGSVVFILSSVMLLLLWVFYFQYHLHIRSQNTGTFRFGVLTLSSVLVCSFLCLIKRCIVLYWKVFSVYDRLHSDIVDIGKQLYFLVLLSFDHFIAVYRCGCDFCASTPRQEELWAVSNVCISGIDVSVKDERKFVRNCLINNITGTMDNITGTMVTLNDIQETTQLFLQAQYVLREGNISTHLCHLRLDDLTRDNTDLITRLRTIVHKGDANHGDWLMLVELLGTEEISLEIVQTWMEKANNRCMFLVNTLISEEEVVNCLDKVISGLIIAVTFVMWLLITGLATLNVLILVTSPLLALAFIFGDTCKNLFQGLVFIYFVHPFHVGDLCLIDGELLEVKRIGVWSTIFSKIRTISTDHDVIYPNTELASKKMINHKTVFDWNDYFEFTLSSRGEETSYLKRQIESHLEQEQFTPKFHSVEYLESGEGDKIGVHVRYNVQTDGWTYFECLKEKQKRRFQFAVDINTLLDQPAANEGISSQMDQEAGPSNS